MRYVAQGLVDYMTKNIKEIEYPNSEYHSQYKDKDIFFYGLLCYITLYFMQFGRRIPFIAFLRIELIIGAILILSAIIYILKGRITLNENKLNKIVILFIVALFISVIFAFVHSRALTAFIRIIKYLSIYLMIIAFIDSEEKLKSFIKVYIIMISIIILEPFILSVQGKGFIYNNHMMRLAGVTSIYGHPNALGMITAASIPFFYYIIRFSNSKKLKIFGFIIILIAIRVIMLTQSRTAFVGTIACFTIIWILSKKKLLGLIIAFMFLSLIWIISPQQTKDRFATLGKTFYILGQSRENLSEDEITSLGSMNSRMDLSHKSLIAFIENPVIGLGLDCFASYSGRKWGIWFPPHNTYLQVLSETGIVGFTLLFMIIIYTFKNLLEARKYLKKYQIKAPFIEYSIYSVSSYYFIYIIVSIFGIELYNNFWWITGGLSIVILRIVKIKTENIKAPAINNI